jgi:hypothetical protein
MNKMDNSGLLKIALLYKQIWRNRSKYSYEVGIRLSVILVGQKKMKWRRRKSKHLTCRTRLEVQ